MKKVLLYFLSLLTVQAVCGFVAAAVWSAVTGSSAITAMQLIVISSLSSIITIALFALMKWVPLSRQFFNSKNVPLMLWSVVIALGMLIPAQMLEELIPQSLTQDIMSDQFKMIMANNWGYIAVGLLAPLAEEIVFRGAIQKAAITYFEKKMSKAKGNIVAVVFTALLFAAVHGNPAQMPHAFLVGLLLGWMCYRSGSIVPGVVLHWVNNSVAFIICAVYPQSYDMRLSELFSSYTLYFVIAIIISLLLFAVGIYQYYNITKNRICYTSTI